MFFRRLDRLLCAALLLAVTAQGDEANLWPLYEHHDTAATNATFKQWVGPLFFTYAGPSADGPTTSYGLRPFFQQSQTGDLAHGNALYPFFTWRRQGDYRAFSFFQLVNFVSDDANPAHPDKRFNVWPLYFSHTAPDPADSYRAFLPFAGTIKYRFAKDRISFVLWPLYIRTEKDGRRITHVPYPFLRFIGGEGYHGFEFWPLFGRSSHDGDYDRWFGLWPLLYKSTTHLSEEVPEEKFAVLPFYARDTAPGYISKTYGWPFFGYIKRTAPYHYDEQHYFWPFLVQGKGDDRLVNRWAPFYTHSVIKGFEKTWWFWPLYRNQRWSADGVAQEKKQVLQFFYWSLEQHSLANPAAAPAHKTHLWPLFSSWDNGAGRQQVQVLSPFEVFFPGNEAMRQLWTPLFALYRYERNDTSSRHALLWNAVTWRRSPGAREFHLGPLYSTHIDVSRRRYALGNGIIGWQRLAGARGRFFLFDFHPKAATVAAHHATSP